MVPGCEVVAMVPGSEAVAVTPGRLVVAAGGGGEASVLGGHVREQVGEVPARARGRAGQIGGAGPVDQVDRRPDGGGVDAISDRMHMPTIYLSLRLVKTAGMTSCSDGKG